MKLKLLFNSLAFLTPHENKTYRVFFPRVCERGCHSLFLTVHSKCVCVGGWGELFLITRGVRNVMKCYLFKGEPG